MQDNKHGGDTQKCHINHGKNEKKKKNNKFSNNK